MSQPDATLHSVAGLLWWVSALAIVYAYAGYPLVIYVWSRLKGRPTRRGDILPRVSLIVPAYNEAHAMKAKIDNCLRLDYPADRLEVLVGSDGSTDGTVEHVREAAEAGRIIGVIYPERRGKVAVINDLVRRASGEILLFSDATSMLEPGSVRLLVSNFADPQVGCVSGVYRVANIGREGGAVQEGLYWRYETFVRSSESRLGTMLGAHGSMYAIRRALFTPLDSSIINDDFVIPLIVLMKGFHSIYDTRAVAWEDAKEMAGFSRRVRIMIGNYQQIVLLLKRRIWRQSPLLLFQLLSHKGFRLISPFWLLTMYASNACLLASPGYRVTFAAQTLFFFAASLGLSRTRLARAAFVAAPYYFCMLNAGALMAWYRILRRSSCPVWQAW